MHRQDLAALASTYHGPAHIYLNSEIKTLFVEVHTVPNRKENSSRGVYIMFNRQ